MWPKVKPEDEITNSSIRSSTTVPDEKGGEYQFSFLALCAERAARAPPMGKLRHTPFHFLIGLFMEKKKNRVSGTRFLLVLLREEPRGGRGGYT